jgi:hypothetical protein
VKITEAWVTLRLLPFHLLPLCLQERFLLKDNEGSENLKWFVPLTWTTASQAPAGFESTEPQEWILPNDISKVLNISISPGEWIIFNNQETGASGVAP